MIYSSITETIGNTPIVKIKGFDEESRAEIYGKIEYFNPGGSVKDRIAINMIVSMIEDGSLKREDTIIEPTSGNTGIGVAMVASSLGIKATFVMPDTMSMERRMLMGAYGAEIILTDGALGMKGAIEKAEELVREKGYVMLSQFENKYNPQAHEKTTAKEIVADFDDLDIFIAGVGTGGTLSGVGKVLKSHYKDIKIIAVEPTDSAVLSGEKSGSHKIQGIGAGFIPKTYDSTVVDDIIKITNEEAFDYTRKVAKTNGLLLGISSGAALAAAIKLAKKLDKSKKILFIAADNGERYLSTPVFKNE